MQKIPRSIKHDTIILGDEGHTQDRIKHILDISVSTIQRAKHNLKEHGDVEGCSQKRGPKGKLDRYMEDISLTFSVVWLT